MSSKMNVKIRAVKSSDFNRCAEIRGMTRENPVSAEVLEEFGITESTWGPQIDDGTIVGVVATSSENIVGFCSGDSKTGEVLVLAILPEYESCGIGKAMLLDVIRQLFEFEFSQLWLAASPDSNTRAHGFYRHIGWLPSGRIDKNGDEILVYKKR